MTDGILVCQSSLIYLIYIQGTVTGVTKILHFMNMWIQRSGWFFFSVLTLAEQKILYKSERLNLMWLLSIPH